MEVQLSPDQQAFVRQAIESGRLEREEDVIKRHFPCGRNASDGDSRFSSRLIGRKHLWRAVKAAE